MTINLRNQAVVIALFGSLAGAFGTGTVLADDASGWAQWRGPLGTGASPDADPPIHWSETENIRFKVEIPGNSLSSPVIWGDTIFLLSAVALDEQAYVEARETAQGTMDAGEWPPDVAPVKQRFLVQARSRLDGSLIWERTARESVPHESHYLDSAWACASPEGTRRQGRQLAGDGAGQELVHDPAHVRPAGAVDRQDLAAGRDRVGQIACVSRSEPNQGLACPRAEMPGQSLGLARITFDPGIVNRDTNQEESS